MKDVCAMTKLQLGILFTFCSAVLFGFYPSAARAVYADGGNAVFMMIVTTACRAAALWGMTLGTQDRVFRTAGSLRPAMTGGLLQALSSTCVFSALMLLPAPIVLIIYFSHTLLLMIYLILRKEMKPSLSAAVTTGIALLGLSFVLDVWSQKGLSDMSLLGLGLSVAAAVVGMLRLQTYGEQAKTRPAVTIGAEAFIFAALFISLNMLYAAPAFPATASGWLWALGGSLSIAIGGVTMFLAIARLGAFQFSLFLKLEPVFTTFFAAVLIHEYLLPHQYAGIVLIVGSLIAYQYLEQRGKIRKMMSRTEEA